MLRSAIVTGAARGIGFSIAEKLLREGWQVIGADIAPEASNAEAVAKLMARGAFLYQQCDITRAEDRQALVERAVRQSGGIGALVNNAGVAPRQRADILEMSEESYDFVMGVNLKATFFLTQACARQMMKQAEEDPESRPAIVFITSMSAYTSSTNRAEYCMSKAGLSMAARLFADRLSACGVNVYEIRPGIIETDMTAGVREKYDALIEGGLLPIQRWGRPEDVASAVWAVCSGLLPYSTGEVINVDGGFHMRRL
jgi:NAD(P)-dependent dehydrogenase (short-subunit alcohol dehydrogenase family)